MKQKLYALDAFFIEKLKLSENDPYTEYCPQKIRQYIYTNVTIPAYPPYQHSVIIGHRPLATILC